MAKESTMETMTITTEDEKRRTATMTTIMTTMRTTAR
jgi:hypothetical protein